MSRFKSILAIIGLYITIAGLVTFSLFILEESYQTAMFGTWPAQDARRWDLVQLGANIMDNTILSMKIVVYAFGWIQPLAFVSYRSYATSAEYYVASLRAKALAHAPELFVNHRVDLCFTPNEVTKIDNGLMILSFGKIGVITATMIKDRPVRISGVLRAYRDMHVVDTRECTTIISSNQNASHRTSM